ncbi:MAG TPA: hypothetical protein ENF23_05925 [Methanosarcinales archaeon]|nr:MAG: hypothetical protein DRO03_07140 [Methanosarcinales archaeon]HDN65811.1 hypothetical protein [Methanosarcinales archaeon]
MKGKNMILLSVAVLAIGLFVLPQTMAMFVGQHNWFSVRTPASQYELCQRCHEAEVQEWRANTGAHAQYAHDNPNDGCFCHQINASKLSDDWNLDDVDQLGFIHWNKSGEVKDQGNWTWRANTTPHAALTVECIDCHTNASAQLQNPNSAHRQFYTETLGKPEGSNNTACMACHTMVGLNITMERWDSGLTIYANHTNYTYGWTVDAAVNTSSRTINSTYWAPGERPNTTTT